MRWVSGLWLTTPMTEKHYDVVIIGGGVSGSSSAYFLASNPGFSGSVLVVEREPTYEHSPSARATGGFRQQFSTAENIQIGLFGVHFIKHIDEYLTVDGEVPDVGFREEGYLLLASPAMVPQMLENNALQRQLGAAIEFQKPEALEERFPWLNTHGLGGGFLGTHNEGWLDPYSLLQAYRRKARSLGVTYIHDEAVDVTRRGGVVTSVTLRDAGEVHAGAVVNAAGASGLTTISAKVGLELPIESRKRCTFVLDCREDIGVTPLTILPEGVGFRPEGKTFLANRAPPPGRDPDTEDVDIDYYLFEDHIWPILAERVPAFEAVKQTGAWCCHYDVNVLDENLIIDHHPDIENFYFTGGFSGHGLQQSPAVGRAMSELIIHGEFLTLDLSRFGYERILANEPILETNCY